MARAKNTKKRKPVKRMSKEDELLQKLKLTLAALGAVILILFVGFQFFGPEIGSFFLLLSKNRDDNEIRDTISPTTPIFSQVPEATKEEKITLNGITEPGSTVRIFVNGPEKEKTTADNDGAFTFVDLELGTSNNIIFAKATDESGNESEKSRVYTIVFDDEAPEIEITEPKNGDSVKNLNRRVLVAGTLSEQAVVKINGRSAVVRSDNTYELLLGVDEGDVGIKVVATDKAGNEAIAEISIKYSKD